jgi:hypothetical protein
MANEATVSATLLFAKGSIASQGFQKTNLQFTVSGQKYVRCVQNIGTSPEALNMGEISTPGLAFFFNLDTTNYVEILSQVAGGVAIAKLKPGEVALFRLPAGMTAPAAQANTSAVNLEYLVLED